MEYFVSKTSSAVELLPIEMQKRPDGFYNVWLRRNIKEETLDPIDSLDEEPQPSVVWIADEVYFVCTHEQASKIMEDPATALEEHFRHAMSVDEQLDRAEERANTADDAIAELSMLISDMLAIDGME